MERLGPYGSGSVNTGLLSLQFSIMVLATVGLALGAVVHERLDAQEEARKARAAEKRFETLVDSGPDAMVITDTDGRIVQVSWQTEMVFGYSRDELLSLRVEDLAPQRLRSVFEKERREFLAAPRTRAMGVGLELFGVRKDGTEFPVEISLSPLQTDSGLRILSSIRDII
ncbi:MAG TPA: PAS domain S-box protein [Candidatus Angelobacter sp.]|nr:PAS domain S-box protein [Candidatus Angelobacter sp.]